MEKYGMVKDLMNAESNTRSSVGSSICPTTSGTNKKMNVNNYAGSESRDMLQSSPYGVSSCAPVGTPTQVFTGPDGSKSVGGVFDSNKPDVVSGEACLYSVGGAKIHCKKDGTIDVTAKGGAEIKMFTNKLVLSFGSNTITIDSAGIRSSVAITTG